MAKKKMTSLVSFILGALLVFSVMTPVSAAGSAIADSNLEKAIKESYGPDENGKYKEVTKEFLAELEWVDGYNKNIKSLKGLENAKKLKGIYVSENKISDLTPLKDLNKLQFIDLSSNQISKISALSNLTFDGIGNINLAGNKLTNIDALSTLTVKPIAKGVAGSVYLNVSSNQLKSLDALKNIKETNRLFASNNDIRSVSSLKNLTALSIVDLSNNKLKTLDGLTLKQEEFGLSLDFSDNQLTDISALSNVEHGYVDLSNNLIRDISSLKNMTGGEVNLLGNPLNMEAKSIIETLKKRGVQVKANAIVKRDVTRVSGSTRYSTATEISKQGWKNGAETVVIARGDDFPDALAGASLAYSKNAPILLTTKDKLSKETKAEIQRLGAKNAIILGGTGAVSANVEKELKDLKLSTKRIAGETRFETAQLIAKEMGGNPSTAIVAVGFDFPDALAVASYAAKNGYPILLTRSDKLPEETAAALKGKTKTIVVGGTAVVNNNVFKQLPGAVRIGGETRYETAAKLIKELKLETDKVFIAKGSGFADALTGSVYAAKLDAPMLLVASDKVPQETVHTLVTKEVDEVVLLGGTVAINDEVLKYIKN